MAANDRRAAARKAHIQKGLVSVNTGNGKGKRTAALDILMRAWGRNRRNFQVPTLDTAHEI
jgi:ATP:corrinoid adenosyltransferase